MIHTIPYFDAHCDTIHRCHTAGTLFRDPELRAFYDTAGDLRRSGGHIDLERAGGFSRYAQFFALYQSPQLVPEGSSMPEQGILLHQRFLREMEENRERILPCRTGAEVDEAVRQGKAAALLSIEGAELLDCDIRRLDTAYDWGVRLLNPVWNYANRLSGSNAQQPEQGLTDYGRDFLQRMEELSIYVDVSHLSDAGFWDVVRLSRRPVVASHSNCRAVCPHRRTLPDDIAHLSRLLTTERAGLDRPYWSSPASISAYLYYFLPWNLVRLTRLLASLPLTDPRSVAPQGGEALLVDVGSGPLTLPLALWLARPEWRSAPVRVLAMDTSSQPLELGKTLMEVLGEITGQPVWPIRVARAPLDQVVRQAGPLLSGGRAQPWIVSAANVLNELRFG